MADKPGSFRTTRMQRRSVTIRRAKEEDAKRVGDNPHSLLQPRHGETEVVARAKPPETPVVTTESVGPGQSRRRVSGPTVVVQRQGAASRVMVSSRMTGRMPSVRVTGGDTIIRYSSGELVVKRSNRRAVWRKRVILAYVGCYAAAFALYLYYVLTGTFSSTPAEYLSRSFGKRLGESVQDLEQAAMAAMRGNRTPAEVRMAQDLVFHDEHNDTIRIQAGDRLTLLTAAKLGQAIIMDGKRGESNRVFDKPFRLYRETYLSNMNWPFWLAAMNAFGFFLALGLFLWRPGRNYLGMQGKKTAASLREARLALEKSDDIRKGHLRLSSDMEERGENMRDAVLRQAAKDQKTALQEARNKAGSITGGVGSILDREEFRIASRLGIDAANEACRRAQDILEKRLGRAEHDLAIEDLIADIGARRASASA